MPEPEKPLIRADEAEAECERLRTALERIQTDAGEAVVFANNTQHDETETYCFGNLIHIQRECRAALKEGTQ